MNTLEILKLVGVQETTSKVQSANGTREFTLPMKEVSASGSVADIKFAIYKSGYIRRLRGSSYCNYQLNPTYEQNVKRWDRYGKSIYTTTRTRRVLINNEQDRLDYLCKYILKNFFNSKSKYMINEWTRSCIAQQNLTVRKIYEKKYVQPEQK